MPITARDLAQDVRERVLSTIESFEAGEQVTGERLYPPPSVDWELVAVRYEVIKPLAATDAGTIAVADSFGNAAIATISLPASTAAGTRGLATLATNRAYLRAGAGQTNPYHAVTIAKTTTGGKVRLWFYYRIVRPNAPL